ncbi:uncharacterized protein JCM6883_004098 [Sporobolomyces salmoneus]|uniref:uncharacterized protein n=1 Tax=Sporobolomyces salmoneus TaxID=183962 RepID=UPI00316CA617
MPQPRTAATTVPWPSIPPPAQPLKLDTVAPGILVIDSFFSSKTLASFLSFLQSPSVSWTAPSFPKKGEATRTNYRFQVQDDEFARQLWEKSGLKDALIGAQGELVNGRNGKKAVGLNGNIRCYKYEKGSFFGPHYDDDCYDANTGRNSEWTLLVYLSGIETGVKGGETAFYPNPTKKGNGVAIVPELRAGRALLHRHGRLCSLHEGRTVEEGTKWVLRSDVMFK